MKIVQRNTFSRTVLAAAGAAMVGLVAGSAWGQVRLNGIELMPAGDAALAPMPDGSLLVSNIGSSGQDGVEVRCNSRGGGSVRISLDEMLIPSPASRELRFRPKGWDGTIKGSLRLASRPPTGLPGAEMDVSCDFAAVSATTVRVTVRDQHGNALHSAAMVASSLQCVVRMSPPAGIVPTCGVAIKTKGTGADNNRVMSVDFGDQDCDVSGLSPATLHEVRSIEFSPETCGQCDSWLGTESLLVTGGGVSQCVVSSARLHTFGMSSHGLAGAHVDEMCDNPADCDNVRRLRVSSFSPGGEDGVAIDLGSNNNGGSVSMRRKGELTGHVTLMKAFDEDGQETGRIIRSDNETTGQAELVFDGIAAGTTEVTVGFHNADGEVFLAMPFLGGLVSVAFPPNCPLGQYERWVWIGGHKFLTCYTPNDYTLPGGTIVAGAYGVSFTATGGNSRSPARSLHIIGASGVSFIDIESIAPASRSARLGGLECVSLCGTTLEAATDGSVTAHAACCTDDDCDGAELRCASEVGAMLTMDVGPLLAAGSSGEIVIRPRGWDATTKGSLRLSHGGGGGGGSGGSLHMEADFSAMEATSMEWRALGADGSVLASGIVSGSSVSSDASPTAGEVIQTCRVAIKRRGTGAETNRMGLLLDFGLYGHDTVTLSAPNGVVVHDVAVFGFDPIPIQAAASFVNLGSMEVTFDGMPSLRLHDASLLTFGSPVSAIGAAQIMEWVGEEEIKLAAMNLGHAGHDGIVMQLGNPHAGGGSQGDGGSMELSVDSCCRGHVTLMKLYDDEEQEVLRLTGGSDADGTSHTMEFDASAAGATSVTVTLRDAFGNTVHSALLAGSGGSLTYVGPCDASLERHVSFDSGGVCMEACDAPVTVHIGLLAYPDVREVCWSLSSPPGSSRAVRSVALTGNPTGKLTISGVVADEGEPPCRADFDNNGDIAVPDIFAFLSAWFARCP